MNTKHTVHEEHQFELMNRLGFQKRRVREHLVFLVFVSPALIWFLIWMIWPLYNMFSISTLSWKGLVQESNFVGLANYHRILQDHHIRNAVRNTAIHVLVALPGAMIPAFILGFFLSLRLPGFRILRFIFFLPAMISVASSAMMFYGIFMPNGLLNSLLSSIGLSSLTHLWLAEPSTVLGSIIALDIWGATGFYGVLFFAVLSSMSSELYEAALLEGASLWTIMWRIAFPLARGFFGVATMLRFLWLLTGSAQNIFLLTRGGPGDYSLTLGYYLFDQAFLTQRLGYSQAIGVVLFIVGILGLVLIRRAFPPVE